MYRSILFFSIVFSALSGPAQQITIDTLADGYLIELVNHLPQFLQTGPEDSIPQASNAATYLFDKGAPELLKLHRLFEAPNANGFTVQILADSIIWIQASIAPSLGFVHQQQKTEHRTKGNSYNSNQTYPGQPVKAFTTIQHKGKYLQNFWFQYMQYKPQTKQLAFHKHLKIKLKNTTPIRKRAQNTRAINQAPTMLIMVNDSMAQSLAAFTNWKKQLGMNVSLHRYPATPTANQIRNDILAYRQSHNLDYVLLVGDHDQLPTMASTYGPSDYAFTTIEGTDVYADLMIGRFPADNNAELHRMCRKSINYEQAAQIANRPLVVGGMASAEGTDGQGDNGESDYLHITQIAQTFHTNGFDSLLLYQGFESAHSVASLFATGHYLFYTGHGDEDGFRSIKFSNDSVRQLTNATNHPILIDAACLNGNFLYDDCMAEQLMKAGNGTANYGTTAIFASSISQLWAPPMLGQDVFARELLTGGANKTMGQLGASMFLELIAAYDYGGIETVYTWTLFGDPSLKPWNATPLELQAQIPTRINVASDSLTIVADSGCLVTLLNGSNILASAETTNGQAILKQGALSQTDSVVLTISKPGHAPITQTLPPYSNAGSYYSITGFSLSDDNNQIPENGEWITIAPSLINYGQQTGYKVQVTVTDPTGMLIFENNSLVLDSIAGNRGTAKPNIKIKTLEKLPDNQQVTIQFRIKDQAGQQNQKSVTLAVMSAKASIEQLAINRMWENNDPVTRQDTVSLWAIIANTGHAPLYGAKLSLQLNDVFVAAMDSELWVEQLPPLSTDTFELKVVIDPTCYQGHQFTGTLALVGVGSIPFSFHYNENSNISIGQKELATQEMLFYNYYKAHKTQVLYRADQFGQKPPFSIDSIGFWLASVSQSEQLRQFANFSIKLRETNSNEFGYAYCDTLGTVVFSANKFTLPYKTGLFFIDIDDYGYAGTANIIVEISWGLNTGCSSYNNSFSVLASKVGFTSAVYGYSDTDTLPAIRESSHYQPDMVLATNSTQLLELEMSLVNNNAIGTTDTFWLKVGGSIHTISLQDSIRFMLPQGSYNYSLLRPSTRDQLYTGSFHLTANGQQVHINYLPTDTTPTPSYSDAFVNVMVCRYADGILIEHPWEQGCTYAVFDMLGRLVTTGYLVGPRGLVVLTSPSGVYIIKLANKKQERVFKVMFD